jgi:hypothetical protein
MRVLLRNSRIGLYYAGRKHWVGRPGAAADLGTIERAAELSREENFDEMEILVDYEDPKCELVLPLKPRNVQRPPHGARAR